MSPIDLPEEDPKRGNEPPQIIHVHVPKNGRLPLWILISVTIGFILPVCSCAFLGLFGLIGLTAFDTDSATIHSSGEGDAVAIVRVEGTITSSDDDSLPAATSGRVLADLKSAAEDELVKAIVLRVDSPGGTVTGSAQIHEALVEFEKPIVVSMVGVAASGGYYVSAPADYIIARPDTVTGSLGVVLTLYNAEDLLDEIGVEVIAITSGPNKTIGSYWEEMTPEQRDIFESSINESYLEFVNIIATGRDLPVETVLDIADGRTYSGRQALELGLVDELGNFQTAIGKAAELGGISGEPNIIEYERLPGFDQFFGGLVKNFSQSPSDQLLQSLAKLSTPTLEYRYIGFSTE